MHAMTGVRPMVTLISALTAVDSDDTGKPWWAPPLGVLSLAAVLKARGVHTEVIDLDLIWVQSRYSSETLLRRITAAVRTSRPRILGLGTICNSYPLTIRLANRLKDDFPHTPIVLGGPQASLVDVATLNAFPFIDFVLRGEAEESFPMLVDSLLAGDSLTRQRGLTFRDGTRLQRNPDAAPIRNLDTLPFPSFGDYANVPQWPSLPLEIGRGCPFSCRFCSTSGFFGRRYRLKSVDHVICEMNLLSNRYGIRAFDLIHDMFTVDPGRVTAFCRRLRDLGSPYTWTCSARTDCVDRTLIKTMRDAGCVGIFFGIETASPRLQRVIHKGLDLDEARAVLKNCDRLGIETTASLIVGYPTESARELEATLSFFVRTSRLDRADAQLHVLAPLPSTSLEAEYRSRLTFDEEAADIPEFGAGQGATDRFLIKKHPDVFSNFYEFPDRARPADLCDISAFFVNLQRRCTGLLLALVGARSTPMELYDTWRRSSGRGETSLDYYRELDFVEEFLAVVEKVYVGRGNTAVDVMWRFYRALMAVGRLSDESPVGPRMRHPGRAPNAVVRLAPGVRVLSVHGDVVKVLAALKGGRRPGLECLHEVTTVSVRKSRNGRWAIEKLPPLATAILGCLDGSIDKIVRKLTVKGVKWENRAPEQFLPEALRVLERAGLVMTSSADQAGSAPGSAGRLFLTASPG
jgi:radical SAM superfamily enzyme YgiQ (UPF0313 family)